MIGPRVVTPITVAGTTPTGTTAAIAPVVEAVAPALAAQAHPAHVPYAQIMLTLSALTFALAMYFMYSKPGAA